MPNWCIGDLKVRGKYKNIKRFLEEELLVVGGSILNRNYDKPTIKEDNYSIEVEEKSLWFRNLYRTAMNDHIDLYFDYDEDSDISKDETEFTFNLGEIQTAWGTDTEGLTKLSKEYDIDFKIYAYEKGMEFNIDFEVHKGEVIKNNEIKFDDYTWECTNPEIGG